jgi:hypothetical protein
MRSKNAESAGVRALTKVAGAMAEAVEDRGRVCMMSPRRDGPDRGEGRAALE